MNKRQKKNKEDWSNLLLVNLSCIAFGFVLSTTLHLNIFGLGLAFFITSMVNYAISSRANDTYLKWDRVGLFSLIASFLLLLIAIFNALSDLH
ncbi:hypothetical protein [Bernardetia sp.]|uniref:hypothetical protein n=1 Tax=Bernardetia sp. TaxID=1937974 RepID=UPI0025C4B075|nr:hypothetical protein [Bernardetia sp.]